MKCHKIREWLKEWAISFFTTEIAALCEYASRSSLTPHLRSGQVEKTLKISVYSVVSHRCARGISEAILWTDVVASPWHYPLPKIRILDDP